MLLSRNDPSHHHWLGTISDGSVGNGIKTIPPPLQTRLAVCRVIIHIRCLSCRGKCTFLFVFPPQYKCNLTVAARIFWQHRCAKIIERVLLLNIQLISSVSPNQGACTPTLPPIRQTENYVVTATFLRARARFKSIMRRTCCVQDFSHPYSLFIRICGAGRDGANQKQKLGLCLRCSKKTY